MILYVDDAGIAAPNKEIIDEFVAKLKSLGFDLDLENNFTEYLGLGIETLADEARHITQKGLIKKVLASADMTNCHPNWTPTKKDPLATDPDGKPFDERQFSYKSIVGMLLYLSNNSRPDITFAVSQVARFTHCPKESHGTAVKMILRYLSRTADKGLIVKPDRSFNLNVHVDADFAGLFGFEKEENPNSARSRYGFIITFCNVPLLWKSQLINEICQSTLHSEYVGLSSAVRALIPIRSLVSDVSKFHRLPDATHQISCKVFEDNQGAYLLATNQRLSPRTRYFNTKFHFFWSYVYDEERNPDGWIRIVKIETSLMNADYLTKGLPRVTFEANRLRVQGW